MAEMLGDLDDDDWDLLLSRIKNGRCTPFLGAGACDGLLPLGKDIAQKWAKKYDYPLPDDHDLSRVSQFLAVDRDEHLFPKEKIQREFSRFPAPAFDTPDEVHATLAALPLPVYVTTNYDNFMFQALEHRHKRPCRVVCAWNKHIRYNVPPEHRSVFDEERDFAPTPDRPVVFHMHGAAEWPESMVLTEDDYLEFLVNLAKENLLPQQIERALTSSSLLFVGYAIADLNFRVLFRALIGNLENNLRRTHISVQLEPDDDQLTSQQKLRAKKYLTKYFGELKIHVYWGSCKDFVRELKQRWENRDDSVSSIGEAIRRSQS